MASSLFLVPFYMCILGLLCCTSVADSRAVYFRDGRSAHYQASLSEEFDIDDGPQTFTMQDHFDWLVPDDEELNFSDYHDPEFNHIHDLPKR
ncbi:uncharacterized protein [Physcomitrium patens]|uniref:uncharacterized protein isoform X3 n=1 Tax=Physcomitrium patens TaxID=3218 RepID=UPI003CCE3450